MRTTIRLREALLRRAKKRALEEKRTLTSIVEEGVTLVLARPSSRPRKSVRLPISRAKGGVREGIDLNRSAELESAMEDA